MVLFVDLDDEAEPPERVGVTPHWSQLSNNGILRSLSTIAGLNMKEGDGEARENPNKNAITEALGCYPYVPPCQQISLLPPSLCAMH
jgi:hypothetical protein